MLTSKPKRNEPCPCGSGRKWKKCHGRQPPAVETSAAPHIVSGIVFPELADCESLAIPLADSKPMDSDSADCS